MQAQGSSRCPNVCNKGKASYPTGGGNPGWDGGATGRHGQGLPLHLRPALRGGTEQLAPGGRDQQGLLHGEQPLPAGEGLQQEPQGEHFVLTLQLPRLTPTIRAQLPLRRRTSSQGTRTSEGFPVGKSRKGGSLDRRWRRNGKESGRGEEVRKGRGEEGKGGGTGDEHARAERREKEVVEGEKRQGMTTL